MNGRVVYGLAALIALYGVCGCANVKVHKVDVDDREAGRDDKVEGFRYYLTRPYLVIASKVTAAISYMPVTPATLKTGTTEEMQAIYFVAAIPDPPDAKGVYHVFNSAGQITPLRADQLRLATVTNKTTTADTKTRTPTLDSVVLEKAIFVQVQTFAMTALLNADDTTKLVSAVGGAYEMPANLSKTKELLKDKSTYPQAITFAVGVAVDAGNMFLNGKTDKKLAADTIAKTLTTTYAPSAPAAPPGTTLPNPTPVPDSGAKASVQVVQGQSNAKSPTAAPAGNTASPTAAQDTLPFQVVFLPDFEEQYAIRNINIMAKSKYKYTFRNGTDLETVSTSYNATDVPVAIVNTVGALLTAVGTASRPAMTGGTGGAGAKLGLDLTNTLDSPLYLRIEKSIEPGVYRVQKSWEKAANAPLNEMPVDDICGLFSSVGLPLVESVSVIDAAEHTKETTPATTSSAPASK